MQQQHHRPYTQSIVPPSPLICILVWFQSYSVFQVLLPSRTQCSRQCSRSGCQCPQVSKIPIILRAQQQHRNRLPHHQCCSSPRHARHEQQPLVGNRQQQQQPVEFRVQPRSHAAQLLSGCCLPWGGSSLYVGWLESSCRLARGAELTLGGLELAALSSSSYKFYICFSASC